MKPSTIGSRRRCDVKRKIAGWRELPRTWQPLLECGHYAWIDGAGLSDEQKERAAIAGEYHCLKCDLARPLAERRREIEDAKKEDEEGTCEKR